MQRKRTTPLTDAELLLHMADLRIDTKYFDYLRYLERYAISNALTTLQANQHALCRAKASECGIDPNDERLRSALWRYDHGLSR